MADASNRRRLAWLLLVLVAWAGNALGVAAEARRVVLLHSFGRDFEPFRTFSSDFRAELTRQMGGSVDLVEVELQGARFTGGAREDAFLTYLLALLAERRVDLVVPIGGPAVRFAQEFRDRLFPEVPQLVAAVDVRHLRAGGARAGDVVLAVRNVPARMIEEILRLLPDTQRVMVVLGHSPLEQFWREELRSEFRGMGDRLTFDWVEDLSFGRVLERAAGLPRRSAILYAQMSVDALGVAHAEDRALADLRRVANAPIFGLHDYQLGRGIVGGPLMPVLELSRRTARAAVRLLAGEAPAEIHVPPMEPGTAQYDWRELRRWGIPMSQMAPGAVVRFREAGFWERYWGRILAAGTVGVFQAVLIFLLWSNLKRRQEAERRAREFGGRLITAQEEERARLARELHDDVSQRLAGVAIDAALTGRAAETGTGGRWEAVREQLARLSEDVHALSYRLHPAILEDLGLCEALRAECEQVSRQHRLEVELTCEVLPGCLSRSASLCLFRVAQEALRNVIRHAGASRARIAVRPLPEGVELSVADDGAGFEPGARWPQSSLGLASMQERVRLEGGVIDLRSSPGNGTQVVVRIPMAAGGSRSAALNPAPTVP